ncbi:ABC-2 family transporter protein [Kineococcus sp. NUM-3379]
MAERVRSPYPAIIASRLRSQLQYRSSFAVAVLADTGFGLVELVTVYVLFTHVSTLGGLDPWQAGLVFAVANAGFALADMVVGHVDTLPTYLRTGTLDAFLLRPASVLGQLVTSDVSLRRLGRVGMAVAVLVVVLPRAGVEWTPAKVVLLASAPLTGAAVFAALFVVAAALQFWLVEGREVVNSFTYGGGFAAQFPAAAYGSGLRYLFTYVVPATATAYLPVLALLELPGPPGTPAWLGWCGPLFALASWGVALLVWRSGVRHYTGAGS